MLSERSLEPARACTKRDTISLNIEIVAIIRGHSATPLYYTLVHKRASLIARGALRRVY